MEITQHQLDLFKQHFPGEDSIQDLDLAEVRRHAAASPVDWHQMDLRDAGGGGGGLSVQTFDLSSVTPCQQAVGWAVADLVFIVLGSPGMMKFVKAPTAQAIGAVVKPAIPNLYKSLDVIAASASTPWARAKATADLIVTLKEASLIGPVVAALTSSMTFWDAVLFGIGFIATLVAALATDGLALAAEIMILFLAATTLVLDIFKVVSACGRTPVADTTPTPVLPPSPDPTPFLPTVALRTVNGYLLSVVDNGGLGGSGAAVSSTATSVGANEVFTVVPVDTTAKTFALRTASGRYLTAVGGGGVGGPNDASSPIHTDTRQLRSWERLHLVGQADGDDRFAFATPAGRYLTAVSGGGVGPDPNVPVNTSATTIGANETFSFVRPVPNGPAAIQWNGGPNDVHLRVYDQDDDGQLFELIHEPTGVWTPNPLGVYPVPETGLAAVHWTDGAGLHIRIYYQDRSDNLCEIGWDTTGGWQSSRTLGPAAPGTNVAAVCWSDGAGAHLRVYYQDVADYLAEYASDPGLGRHGPGRLMPAAPGTAIAALAWKDTAGANLERIDVFTQDTAHAITILRWFTGIGWTSAIALFPADAGTGITAVQWRDDKSVLHKRLYFQNSGLHLVEHAYDGVGWTKNDKTLADLGLETGLSVVRWAGPDGTRLRVYYNADGVTRELAFDPSTGWGSVSTLPVPAPATV